MPHLDYGDHPESAGSGAKIITGTYVGDGTSGREIDIGGEALLGFVLGSTAGSTDCMWFIMKGAETKFPNPTLLFYHSSTPNLATYEAYQVKSSSNGFTLATASPWNSNVDGTTYYYVAVRL